MGNLHVALQDGFDNDTIEVRVNGQTVYERDGVTTMTQISLADAFDVDIDGPVDLRSPSRTGTSRPSCRCPNDPGAPMSASHCRVTPSSTDCPMNPSDLCEGKVEVTLGERARCIRAAGPPFRARTGRPVPGRDDGRPSPRPPTRRLSHRGLDDAHTV